MGYATIVGGGEGGRYTVELNFGEEQRVALIASIDQALVIVGEKIVDATAKVAAADAAVAAQQVKVNEAAAEVALAAANLAPGTPFHVGVQTDAYWEAVRTLHQIEQAGEPRRIALRTLKRSQQNLIAQRSAYTQLVVVEQRGVWCCTFTEDAAGQVATIDVPGESTLTLIAPQGRPWAPVDGVMKARELMSPEQAYFNAAILPGWQKFKPTYRWGTISAINYDANTASVTLGPATSSAQRLDVNVEASIVAVPVSYADEESSCNCRAFTVGDRVILQFLAQAQQAPLLIGYLDNPRPCPPKFDDTSPVPAIELGPGESYALDDHFMGGAEPLSYDVVSGALPAGVVLDGDSGTITVSGETDGGESAVVVRCSDVFYQAGVNRRYDDTNEFNVVTFSPYIDVSDSVHAAVDSPNGVFGSIGVAQAQVVFTSGFAEGFVYYTSSSSGVVAVRQFKLASGKVYPNYWIRQVLLEGSLWNGGFSAEPNVWYQMGQPGSAGAGNPLWFVTVEGGSISGVCRMDLASAPSEAAILCTLTVDASVG